MSEPTASGPDDAAERAFIALRDEVAAQRHLLQAIAATDYGPTLGALLAELRTCGRRLASIEAHPALQMTPDAWRDRFATVQREAGETTAAELRLAHVELAQAQHRLEQLISTAETHSRHRRRLILTAIAAALIGAGLGAGLAIGIVG